MNELATTVNTLITTSSEGFATTLAQYKWDLLPDSQLQAAKQALMKNDYIMKIAANNPESVHDSLMKSAILGLDLTEGKKQGWLLPRKSQKKDAKGNYITEIVLQVGYKGVEAIHQRMGVIDTLSIRVVRENDIFAWTGDDQDKPIHQYSTDKENPNWMATDEERGAISGAFAVTYYPDKTIRAIVVPVTTIFKNHRDRSDSYKSYLAKKNKGEYAHPPPWVTDEQSMVEKTMAFIAAKQWPANIRNSETSLRILETLHEIDVSDYSLEYSREEWEYFNRFINELDELGIFLFRERIEIETYAALHRNFMKDIPRGEKGQKRALIEDMMEQGREIFNIVVDGLKEDDDIKVIEAMEGCLVMTEKMMLAKLDNLQRIKYLNIMEEAKENAVLDNNTDSIDSESNDETIVIQ